MGGVILLTGATGFLGAQVARRLLERTDLDLVALVQAPDQATARRLLLRAWWDFPELAEEVGGAATLLAGERKAGRVLTLAGDVREPRLGLEPATWSGLAGRLTHIIHAAADLRLTAPLAELRPPTSTAWPTCWSWPAPPTATTGWPAWSTSPPPMWPACGPVRWARMT
jgi:long-chain acyl-CoA synthetase